MPAGPTTWALAFPQAYIALRTPEGREILPPALVSAFDADGRLTAGESSYVENFLSEDLRLNSSGGARVWDAPTIPNGQFFYGEEFQIYTVQRGTLQGRRVIKVRDAAGPGGWRAFAYVGRDGGFELWARFQNHADESYVLHAHDMIDALRHTSSMRQRIIEGTVHCVLCNEPIVTGLGNPHGMELGVCEGHAPAANPATNAGLQEAQVEAEQRRARRPRRPVSARNLSELVDSGDFRIVRSNPLPLCEVTGSEVQ